MASARIRSIVFKDGRAPIRVLHNDPKPQPGADEADWRRRLVEHATSIAQSPQRITGYVVLAVFEDGGFNYASRLDHDACAVPASLWPSYVEEVVRSRMVTGELIDDRGEKWR